LETAPVGLACTWNWALASSGIGGIGGKPGATVALREPDLSHRKNRPKSALPIASRRRHGERSQHTVTQTDHLL
jgi:hypothetical protein